MSSNVGDRTSSDPCRVWVGNLHWDVSPEDLRALAEEFGPVHKARVCLDPNGVSRGFGFLSFRDPADAQRAIAGLDGFIFAGRRLLCRPAQNRKPRPMPGETHRSEAHVETLRVRKE
jgi:RNA recognition motif-containing protein